jgi:beta-phosphoglucomutase-like phosphatase (HAD superfamily)
MNTNSPAIFFDLDGALVDTEPLKFIVHRDTFDSRGGHLDSEKYASIVGQSHDRAREYFLDLNQIKMSAEEYDRLWEDRYLEQVYLSTQAYPDDIDFLQKARTVAYNVFLSLPAIELLCKRS